MGWCGYFLCNKFVSPRLHDEEKKGRGGCDCTSWEAAFPNFVLSVFDEWSIFPSSGVLLENFPVCKELLIPPGTQNYVVRMRLYDLNKHLLCLTIRIILRAQGALKVLISAPYWLVNKTGT